MSDNMQELVRRWRGEAAEMRRVFAAKVGPSLAWEQPEAKVLDACATELHEAALPQQSGEKG